MPVHTFVKTCTRLRAVLCLLGWFCVLQPGQCNTIHSLLDENLRITADFGSRVYYDTRHNRLAHTGFAGMDLHKVFSTSQGDWATLLVQGYWTRIDNLTPHPAYFEDSHDWEFVCRICNINFTGLTRGWLNLRVGHFEIPYGLEQSINTNGTLLDYTHSRNLGLKADWGLSVNGHWAWGEYELAWSRGTGVEWDAPGNTMAWSGRIGTPCDQAIHIGLSAFHARLADLPNSHLHRTRVGLNAQYAQGPVVVLGEVSAGSDNGQTVLNSLIELDWHNPYQTILAYAQFERFTIRSPEQGHWQVANFTNLGLQYNPDNHWSASTQWRHDFSVMRSARRSNIVSFQLRYRF